jgi:hypothetical protein
MRTVRRRVGGCDDGVVGIVGSEGGEGVEFGIEEGCAGACGDVVGCESAVVIGGK